MKGNIDCPNIQGWVAIRVYGPQASIPQENSSSNEKKQENQIQELFEFTKCFLTIEEGCLRWYNHQLDSTSKGCGYIVSKLNQQQTFLSTADSNGGKATQILIFQILTSSGIMIMELLVKSLKVWSTVLELHYLNHCQNITNLPSYFLSNDNPLSLEIPNSYELQHSIHFTIQDKQYEIPLSLHDSVEEIADLFMKHHNLPKQYKIMILNKLYFEQNRMFSYLFPYYSKLENEKNSYFLQFLQMEEKAFLSELHANKLQEYIESIELLLPQIQRKVACATVAGQTKKPSQPKANDFRSKRPTEVLVEDAEDDEDDDEYTDDIHDQLQDHFPDHSQQPSAGKGVQPNTEFHGLRANASQQQHPAAVAHHDRPSSPSSYNLAQPKQNWKILYEQTFQELQEMKKEKDKLARDLKFHLANSTKQQQIQSLTAENQQLKELTTTMREEIIQLNQQIEDIQKSAFQAMEALAQQQEGYEEKLPEDDDRAVHEGMMSENEYINDMYALYKEKQHNPLSSPSPSSRGVDSFSPGSSPRHIPFQSPEPSTTGQQQQPAQSMVPFYSGGGHQNDYDYEEWKRLPMDKNDWTVNYYDILFPTDPAAGELSSLSSSIHLHYFSLLHSFRWSYVEETIFHLIYQQYCIANKAGMTLTSFIRFTKEFNILVMFGGGNPNQSLAGGGNNGNGQLISTDQLIYGTNNTPSSSNNDNYSEFYELTMSQSKFGGSSPAAMHPPTIQQPPFPSDVSMVPSHVTIDNGLSNGEISLIFTNVSRIDTKDTVKKGQVPVFKVRSIFTPANQNMMDAIVGSNQQGKGKSKFHSPAANNTQKKTATANSSQQQSSTGSLLAQNAANNNGVNTIISKNQFILALQMIANRLYSNVIEVAAGNILPDSTNSPPPLLGTSPTHLSHSVEEAERQKKQKEIERVAMELFLMKVIIPNVINYEMVPWSLVFYEECLSYLNTEKSFLYQLLQNYSIVLFEFFYFYTIYHQYEFITPLAQMIYSNQTATMQSVQQIIHYLEGNIKITFQDLIKLFRSCSFIPYMIQEPQLYSLFREVLSFSGPLAEHCNSVEFPRNLFATSIPSSKKKSKQPAPTTTESSSPQEDGVEWNDLLYHEFIQYLVLQMDAYSHWALLSPQEDGLSSVTKSNLSNNGKKKEESLNLVQFFLLLCCISIQAFPNMVYGKRMESLFGIMKRHMPEMSTEANL